jgi:hypothetical protein
MQRLRLADPVLRLDGAPLALTVELLASYHGAYHLALSTTVVELGLHVDTVCLGHPDGPLQVSHLGWATSVAPELRSFAPDTAAASLKDARGLFLHEHLYEVKTLVERVLERPVQIDVPAAAVTDVALA